MRLNLIILLLLLSHLVGCASKLYTLQYDKATINEEIARLHRDVKSKPLPDGKIFIREVTWSQREDYHFEDGKLEILYNQYHIRADNITADFKAAFQWYLSYIDRLAEFEDDADVILDINFTEMDDSNSLSTQSLEFAIEVKAYGPPGSQTKTASFKAPLIGDSFYDLLFGKYWYKKTDQYYKLNKNASSIYAGLIGSMLIYDPDPRSDNFFKTYFKYYDHGFERLAQGSFLDDAKNKAAEKNRKSLMEVQALAVVRTVINQNAGLNQYVKYLGKSGAICEGYRQAASDIGDVECEYMTGGGSREYGESQACQSLKDQVYSPTRNERDRYCSAFKNEKSSFTAGFGAQSNYAAQLVADEVKANDAVSHSITSQYADVIRNMKDLVSAAQSEHEAEIRGSSEANFEHFVAHVKRVSEPGKVDQMMRKITNDTVQAYRNMGSTNSVAAPKTLSAKEMSAMDAQIAALSLQLAATKLNPGPEQALMTAQQKCSAAGGSFYLNKQTKDYNCVIVHGGKNSVTGLPAQHVVGPRNNAKVITNGGSRGVTESSGVKQTSAASSSNSPSRANPTNVNTIKVSEAKALCFKRVMTGKPEGWKCIGPAQYATQIFTRTEAESLDAVGCSEPRKRIHNVRANYKEYNTVDYVHIAYGCGKPMEHGNINIDTALNIKWPADAVFIEYTCPQYAANRKAECR